MHKNFKVEGLDPDKLNPKNYGGMCSRETVVIGNGKKDYNFEGGIETVATTEQPAIIIDWERWEYIREVLPMKYAEMPDNNETPLLDSHSRNTIKNILGSARDWMTKTAEKFNELVTKVFVSSVEKDLRTNIQEGHVKNVSLGYQTKADYTVEIPRGATVTIDGVQWRNDFNDNLPFLVRTWWKGKELSLVPIGADNLAKFRAEMIREKLPDKTKEISNEQLISAIENAIENKDLDFEKMVNEILQKNNSQTSIKIKGDNNIMDKPEELTVEQRAELEIQRRTDLHELAEGLKGRFKGGDTGLKTAVTDAIEKKWSVEQFKSFLFDNIDSSTPIKPVTDVDMGKNDLSDYNITDGINDILSGKFGAKKSGLVKEVSDFIAGKLTKLGVPQHDHSFFVPNEYWGKSLPMIPRQLMDLIGMKEAFYYNQRAMDAGTAGSGGINLVGNDYRGDLFIEVLRSKLALGQAGVSMLTGLKENITIPKQLTDGTFEIVGESTAGTESSLTFDQLEGSPKIGTGYQEFTKLLLMQSNPSIEALVRDSLLSVATRGIDKYGIVGGGGITGLINESGVGAITIDGDPSWEEIVSFETALETANAAGLGDISWLMAPSIKGRCKVIPKLSGSQYSGWLMETNGDMNGYSSVISTIMNLDPLNGYYLALGIFKQMYLCSWGATEIQVNPFIKMKEGIIQVVLFAYFDWLVRQPTAFAISDDVNQS